MPDGCVLAISSKIIYSSETMSKEQNKSYGKSIRTKLLNVARKENVFNQTILTRYFQERLSLQNIADSLQRKLLSEGGCTHVCIRKICGSSNIGYRFPWQ